MTNTLALAARLRALPDADLLVALAERSYRRAGVSDFFDLADALPPSLAPVPDTERRFTDRLGAERAFEAAAGVSELLAELSREGARELQKGGLALPATKRVAGALSIDVEAVPTVVSVAARAG